MNKDAFMFETAGIISLGCSQNIYPIIGNMSDEARYSIHEVRRLHRRLLDYWSEGQRDLVFLKGCREAYQLKPFSNQYLEIVVTATFKTAILTAANFLYSGTSSIRLGFFLNSLRGLKLYVAPKKFAKMRKQIGSWEHTLEEQRCLKKRILSSRHLGIAHIDKRQVFDAKNLQPEKGATLKDLEFIYDFLWEVLAESANFLDIDLGVVFLSKVYEMQVKGLAVDVHMFLAEQPEKNIRDLIAETVKREADLAQERETGTK